MSYTKPQFDVFLAHNSSDKPQVKVIAEELKRRNLEPWLDEEQIRPGSSIQDEIQEAIPVVESAAVFIGIQGLGKWQNLELKTFITRCVDNEVTVIPVLLPGVSDFPEKLRFLKEFKWIKFLTLDDEKALDSLEWGITGQKPQKNLQLNYQKPGQIPQQELLEEIDGFLNDKQTQKSEPQNHQLSEVAADYTELSSEEVVKLPLSEDIYSVDLRSECNVDYTQLRNLLANKDWKQADEETFVVMLKATRREEEGWLITECLKNFPYTDLRTIDQLWLTGSNRQFGFSVQKRIWESVGGNLDATYPIWLEFCKHVEWPVNEKWIMDVIYNTSSRNGHLPIIRSLLKSKRWEFWRNFFSHPSL